MVIALPAQTFTKLTDLSSTNAASPDSPLVQSTDGNFYGTTGANEGNVFNVSPQGVLTLLHNFGGTDGGQPSGVILATRRKLLRNHPIRRNR